MNIMCTCILNHECVEISNNDVFVKKWVAVLDIEVCFHSFEQHCCNEDGTMKPLLLVTASVDKMVLKKPIHIGADFTIVGAVTWVGRSSMEIQLELTQSAQGTAGLVQVDSAFFDSCFNVGFWFQF